MSGNWNATVNYVQTYVNNAISSLPSLQPWYTVPVPIDEPSTTAVDMTLHRIKNIPTQVLNYFDLDAINQATAAIVADDRISAFANAALAAFIATWANYPASGNINATSHFVGNMATPNDVDPPPAGYLPGAFATSKDYVWGYVQDYVNNQPFALPNFAGDTQVGYFPYQNCRSFTYIAWYQHPTPIAQNNSAIVNVPVNPELIGIVNSFTYTIWQVQYAGSWSSLYCLVAAKGGPSQITNASGVPEATNILLYNVGPVALPPLEKIWIAITCWFPQM